MLDFIISLAIIVVITVAGSGIFAGHSRQVVQDKELVARGNQIESRIIAYYYNHSKQFPPRLDTTILGQMGMSGEDAASFNYTHSTDSFTLQADLGDGSTWTSTYSGRDLQKLQ